MNVDVAGVNADDGRKEQAMFIYSFNYEFYCT